MEDLYLELWKVAQKQSWSAEHQIFQLGHFLSSPSDSSLSSKSALLANNAHAWLHHQPHLLVLSMVFKHNLVCHVLVAILSPGFPHPLVHSFHNVLEPFGLLSAQTERHTKVSQCVSLLISFIKHTRQDKAHKVQNNYPKGSALGSAWMLQPLTACWCPRPNTYKPLYVLQPLGCAQWFPHDSQPLNKNTVGGMGIWIPGRQVEPC